MVWRKNFFWAPGIYSWMGGEVEIEVAGCGGVSLAREVFCDNIIMVDDYRTVVMATDASICNWGFVMTFIICCAGRRARFLIYRIVWWWKGTLAYGIMGCCGVPVLGRSIVGLSCNPLL